MKKHEKTLKIKTPYQLEREAKESQIVQDWNDLMSQPGAMITAVDKVIMNRYKIYGTSTLWTIRKRVAARQADQFQNQEA